MTETRADGGAAPGGDPPLSPAEALAVVQEQRRRTAQSLHPDVSVLLAAWGVTWLAGFGASYFAARHDPLLPWWAAWTVIGVLNAGALAVAFGQPIRRGRGIEGPSRQVMSMFLAAWPLAILAIMALNVGMLNRGLPPRLAELLWPGSSAVMIGVLFLAAGFLFRDRISYGLGLWTMATGVASVFAGVPGNFAVLSLAGGGGFLVAAAPGWWQGRRSRP